VGGADFTEKPQGWVKLGQLSGGIGVLLVRENYSQTLSHSTIRRFGNLPDFPEESNRAGYFFGIGSAN
jgi:hypothetical protein